MQCSKHKFIQTHFKILQVIRYEDYTFVYQLIVFIIRPNLQIKKRWEQVKKPDGNEQ